MKKHLLFGLLLPILSLVLLLTVSFPFINFNDTLVFSLNAKIIIGIFLALTIIFLVIDGLISKCLRISLIVSLVPLLFLNNSFGYAFIYVVAFFYIFYLLVMYSSKPRGKLTYGLYNKTSYYIYTISLGLLAITLSVIFLSYHLYYYLILSFGLAFLLIIAYNSYYNHAIEKEKKLILRDFKASAALSNIYARYNENMNNDTISSISLLEALGYLLEGSYLDGAKAMDRISGVKLFDISLYYELRIAYDFLVNKSFNRVYKLLDEFDEYIKKIKSSSKRKYFYKRFDLIHDFYYVMGNKKQKPNKELKYEGLDKLYLYTMNSKLNIKQDLNSQYEKSGFYLLFF